MRSPEGMELATLCIDLGYKLADKPSDLTRDQINFLIAALNYRYELLRESSSSEDTTKIVIVEE